MKHLITILRTVFVVGVIIGFVFTVQHWPYGRLVYYSCVFAFLGSLIFPLRGFVSNINIWMLTLKYAATWLFLSAIYFFSCEDIVATIAPGFDNVEMWLVTVFIGWGAIFVSMATALGLALLRRKRYLETVVLPK